MFPRKSILQALLGFGLFVLGFAPPAHAACNPPVIGWEEGGFAPFAEVGTGSITVQYHDQCGQEEWTRVYARPSGGGWWRIASTGFDTVGWRTAQYSGLEPGEIYCFIVKNHRDGVTRSSAVTCQETQSFEPLVSKVFKVADVGPSSDSLGFPFVPQVTGLHSFSATRLAGVGCPGLVIRDGIGNLIAYRRCQTVETYLTAGREYRVFLTDVRAREFIPSSCQLRIDGTLVNTSGCSWQTASLWDVRREMKLEAVHLPPERYLPLAAGTAAVPPKIRMLVLPSSRSTTRLSATGNGTAGGANLVTPGSYVAALALFAFDRPSTTPIAQPIRLVRNDVLLAGHDADGDGLGDDLEYAVGTCFQRSGQILGFSCADTFDPRDTDGDGISDLWELLGRKNPGQLWGPDQPLPYWGANPRHKDLFLELDFRRSFPSEPEVFLSPEAAQMARAMWGFDNVANWGRRQLNAQDLLNLDGEPGIALHVDSGLAAQNVADWTTYGDWGGHNVFAPVWDPATMAWRSVRARDIWDEAMPEIRYGIFRHTVGDSGNGGQNLWGPTASFGLGGGHERSADLLVHETGHTLGLDHAGPNVMHSGPVPGYDPENGAANTCKPFYISVMNYAYETLVEDPVWFGFADDYDINFSPMNHMAMVERDALGHYLGHAPPEARQLAIRGLAEVFKFAVDATTGDVDWNRDGRISSQPVRAGVSHTGKDCDQGRKNFKWLASRPKTDKSMAAEFFESAVRLAWSEGGFARLAAVDFDRDCATIGEGHCVREIAPRSLPTIAADTGVDLERIDTATTFGVQQRLVLVALDKASNTLSLTERAPGGAWSTVKTLSSVLPNGSILQLDGEPELVRLGAEDSLAVAKLIFKDTSQKLYLRTIGVAGGSLQFGPIEPLLFEPANGSPPTQLVLDVSTSSPAALTMVRHDMEASRVTPSTPKSTHLFVPMSGGLQISRLVSKRGNIFRHAQDVVTQPIRGKVAPVFVGLDDQDVSKGLLSVYYVPEDDGDADSEVQALRVVRAMNRGVYNDATGGVTETFVVEDWGTFDLRAVVRHVAAVFEPGVHDQPQLLLARVSAEGQVVYRPRPDNVWNFNYYGYNDWLTLRYSICHQVAEADGRVAQLGGTPIGCRPYPRVDETHNRF